MWLALWLPRASGEKASCRYLWNLWYRTDVGETCGTWFIRWISSGFFGGFLVEAVKKLFIFQGQFGELPLLVLVVMWFSKGLFSQQLPTHSDFGIIGNLPDFSCGNCCPFTIIVHLLNCFSYYLLILLHVILLSPYRSSPGFENPAIRWNLTHRIELGLSSTKIKKSCCQKTHQHLNIFLVIWNPQVIVISFLKFLRSDGSEQSFLGGAVIRNLTQERSTDGTAWNGIERSGSRKK